MEKLELSSTAAKPIPSAWVRLLRAHAELTRRMDARLRAEHGLSLREYEVLLALADAPGARLRRVDLAAKVLLTQSGVTRLLEALEREGLVGKAASADDRRVSYAALTKAGRDRLCAAGRAHREDIADHFAAHLTERELRTLDRLLAKLPGAEDEGEWAQRPRGG
jgi:DNA-binding MarR family transcriptional regulator